MKRRFLSNVTMVLVCAMFIFGNTYTFAEEVQEIKIGESELEEEMHTIKESVAVVSAVKSGFVTGVDGNIYYYMPSSGEQVFGERWIGGYWYYFDEVTGAKATGWTNHHGHQYYYDSNGRMQYGNQTIDGNQYYFDPVKGVMFIGERVENGHWVYYSEVNGAKAYGWTEHHGNRYYYDSNGWMKYGNQVIDGNQYYFDPVTGVMFTGERMEKGHWVYYSEANGAKARGWTEHHGNRYYYDDHGWMKYGNQTIDGCQYYFHPVTGVMFTGERVEKGHWVYYSESTGTKAYGWTEHHGNRYYYDSNGWMKYGTQIIDGKQYSFDKITGILKYGFYTVNGKVYYRDPYYNLVHGKLEADNKVYLFDDKTGELKLGMQVVDGGTYYYIDQAPYVYTGETYKDGAWRYFNEETGRMATGWTKHHGNTYYYDQKGAMQYGNQIIDEKEYYFDLITGVMFTGERVENGHWVYYSERDGSKAKGWTGHHGNMYYYDENGYMLYGEQMIDGMIYTFNSITGALYYDHHKIEVPNLSVNGLYMFNTEDSCNVQRINESVQALSSKGYKVSFVMIDLFTGQGISYNADDMYFSASTIKGPYVVCLNQEIPSSKDRHASTMTKTIKESDNYAYRALKNTYGSKEFTNWLADAGCSWVKAKPEYTDITAEALAKMWMKNYNYFTSDEENSRWCNELFVSTKESFISEAIGTEYTVYSKAGWMYGSGYYRNQHDGGIVMKDGNPYVLTVLSNAYGKKDLLRNLVSAIDDVHSEIVQ